MTATIDRHAHLGGSRAFRVEAYVDREFERVRSYISASPDCLAGDGVAALRLGCMGLDLSRPVVVTIGDVEMGSRFARTALRWADARRPGRFPVLNGTVEINPARAGGRESTQLIFSGTSVAPFGRLGAVLDGLLGRHLVSRSVQGFVARLAERLEREIPPGMSSAARHL